MQRDQILRREHSPSKHLLHPLSSRPYSTLKTNNYPLSNYNLQKIVFQDFPRYFRYNWNLEYDGINLLLKFQVFKVLTTTKIANLKNFNLKKKIVVIHEIMWRDRNPN